MCGFGINLLIFGDIGCLVREAYVSLQVKSISFALFIFSSPISFSGEARLNKTSD